MFTIAAGYCGAELSALIIVFALLLFQCLSRLTVICDYRYLQHRFYHEQSVYKATGFKWISQGFLEDDI
jgi:hypothetical protein